MNLLDEIKTTHPFLLATCVAAAAVILLPHFFPREQPNRSTDHYIDSRIKAIPDNTCVDPLPPDGSPMECKWVFVDAHGQRWVAYTRRY